MMPLKDKKGIMLIACYLVVVVLSILGSAFLIRSVGEKRIAERERDTIKALYLAEAGIDDAARGIYVTFAGNFPNPQPDDFNWFNLLNEPRGDNPPEPHYDGPPTDASLGDGTYTVTIVSATVDAAGGADVVLESTGTIGATNVSRTVRTVLRYGSRPAEVFDYPYFVNNLGWFWGTGIIANGNIRSNGDFSFNGSPTVNGDIYASANPELGVDGDISGVTKNDSIAAYRAGADLQARPTNPTADGPGDYSYPDGYDGDSERFPGQPLIVMPYLSDLQSYRDLAVAEGGTLSQGGDTIVNAVYGDDASEAGPDGIEGTPDDGCVVLIGTEDEPIEISGPVVIERDVVIRGVVTGQGTIYSGRNTHVVGNITYADPPAWPKPDVNPDTTDETNAEKDFIGLASRGNLVLGNYTTSDWQSTVGNYLQPPFTSAYTVEAEDADIGYVTGYDAEGNPYFDGIYTNADGGAKDDGTGGEEPRKYYESSLSDELIDSISEASNKITTLDAVSYNNHAFTGRVGKFTVNGNIVCRDEAIIYTSKIIMNHDLRAKTERDRLYLPVLIELSPPETISWRED
ncbi:MAG: type II secretion system protein [Candidatus Omnitrophota bacterium]|nr:MAG: type II secretion system protein [Candidatus Omnitrophota bacterium]